MFSSRQQYLFFVEFVENELKYFFTGLLNTLLIPTVKSCPVQYNIQTYTAAIPFDVWNMAIIEFDPSFSVIHLLNKFTLQVMIGTKAISDILSI